MAAAERDNDVIPNLLTNPKALRDHVARALFLHCPENEIGAAGNGTLRSRDPESPNPGLIASSVLFLLTMCPAGPDRPPEACLILNKRSQRVRQPGDLCYPGGSPMWPLDSWIAGLSRFPGWKVFSHPQWSRERRKRPGMIRQVAPTVATALREGWEEMRLNPFHLRFLGMLRPHRLTVYHRRIFPVVVWTDQQSGFRANWEVDKIILLPVRELFDSSRYARFRPDFKVRRQNAAEGPRHNGLDPEYPCFLVRTPKEREILWGVTFRITMTFLERAFGFDPPNVDDLPLLSERLPDHYLKD